MLWNVTGNLFFIIIIDLFEYSGHRSMTIMLQKQTKKIPRATWTVWLQYAVLTPRGSRSSH